MISATQNGTKVNCDSGYIIVECTGIFARTLAEIVARFSRMGGVDNGIIPD
ncbi:hypothetical protein ETAE_2817 [Edwardsiella piscicida]|uniref:Uncharacterized protein n=1 Tax=Edwardsiella piscicida TaxID=1263550 RepID=A0AAU8PPQ1_EDWPI|nr:hypothetical protein ETAE_2817 [Edwardsiella tarda EIB202]